MDKKSPNRRTFLKTTVAAAAGMMIIPRHVLGGPGFIAPSLLVIFFFPVFQGSLKTAFHQEDSRHKNQHNRNTNFHDSVLDPGRFIFHALQKAKNTQKP